MAFAIKTVLFLIAGTGLGVFAWLWMTFGQDVVLAYAAGIAMQCF